MSVNLEAKIDVSDSVNDIVKKTLSEPSKESGKALKTMIGFFNNTILYPLQKYNLYAESKLIEYSQQLEQRINKIPKEKLVNPSINIIGPTMEGLKYNLDEKHIKEMFLNILSSDINVDKKSLVLPAYIEIIKQISNDDAKFLKTLYEIYNQNNSIDFSLLFITLKSPLSSNGYVLLDKYIIPSRTRTIKPKQVVFDNLIRLGIIECIEGKSIAGSQLYEIGFNIVKYNYKDIPESMGKISYNEGILKITEFGLNFIKVCIEKT